jgi:hypothetical protein
METLHIAAFGHSIALRGKSSHTVKPWINILADKPNLKIVNSGVILCSIERILWQLKQHKRIDLAILFYGDPSFYFTPNFPNRDFKYFSEEKFDDKASTFTGMDQVQDQLHESFLKGTHINKEEFLAALKVYNKWFFDHTLQRNRATGAIMQIDQYLKHRQIPAIHCPSKRDWNFLPPWFEFQTGIVDYSIPEFQYNHYRENDGLVSPNHINQEGNEIIAEKILSMMPEAFRKAEKSGLINSIPG